VPATTLTREEQFDVDHPYGSFSAPMFAILNELGKHIQIRIT
jgi:hypothetical protein